MKASVLQENLKAAIAVVLPAVAKRSTLPVLSNIALTAADGVITLAAMDMKIAILYQTAASVAQPGGITVPASMFAGVVDSLPKGEISLSLNAKTQTLTLIAGRNGAKIKGIDIEEFPILGTGNAQPVCDPPASLLRRLIGGVVRAAARDESRPAMNAVYVRLAGDRIEMVATDGFQLARRSFALDGADVAEPVSLLVPRDTLLILASVMDKMSVGPEHTVNIAVRNRQQVIFSLPGFDLISQLVEANFPDYIRIIPSDYTTQATIDRAALQRATATARLFDAAALLTIAPDVFRVAATSQEDGDVDINLDADVTGSACTLRLNAAFAAAALSALDGEQVLLQATTSVRPFVLRPANEDDDHLIAIMPMSLDK